MHKRKTEDRKRVTLIYDGTCPICSGTVEWIEKNEQEGAFEMVPCQSDSLGEKYPDINFDECMRAMHLVLPDGHVLACPQCGSTHIKIMAGEEFFLEAIDVE